MVPRAFLSPMTHNSRPPAPPSRLVVITHTLPISFLHADRENARGNLSTRSRSTSSFASPGIMLTVTSAKGPPN